MEPFTFQSGVLRVEQLPNRVYGKTAIEVLSREKRGDSQNVPRIDFFALTQIFCHYSLVIPHCSGMKLSDLIILNVKMDLRSSDPSKLHNLAAEPVYIAQAEHMKQTLFVWHKPAEHGPPTQP